MVRALPNPADQEAVPRAAGRDEANRQMRAAGRTAWSLDDYRTAARVMRQTLREIRGYRDDGEYWTIPTRKATR